MNPIALHDYLPIDSREVDALAIAAFEQFKDAYTDWPVFQSKIATMSALSAHGELIVARQAHRLVGAVAYIGPQQPKSQFFDQAWPIMRMLVVSPEARGLGVGRLLADECIARGRRDRATVFALHTSELMAIALPMYQRMGFEWHAAAPDIHGVAYGVYLKQLQE